MVRFSWHGNVVDAVENLQLGTLKNSSLRQVSLKCTQVLVGRKELLTGGPFCTVVVFAMGRDAHD